MAIDIGGGAVSGNGGFNFYNAARCKTNPANADGSLDTIEIYVENTATVTVYTYAPAAGPGGQRDSEALGSVSSGAKRTFTGKSLDVATGDYIGAQATESKNIRRTSSGGSGYDGDVMGVWIEYDADGYLSLYATGTETSAGLAVQDYYYQNIMR